MKYRDDPLWADIEKVPQDDGPNPIVRIAYSDTFVDVMDCFRGVLRTNEFSERTLKLTEDVIACNPANYTAWHYRRKILIALGSNLDEEFEYTEKMALSNPKNYQIWHHRREICQLLNDGSREKAFCAKALEEDAKNYHAWAHRQWVIQTFHLFESELDFVNEMLTKDIRNNSAWNHRWFVLKHTNKNDLLNNNLILRQKEMDFAFEKIHLAVHNESAWNFVRGLLLRGKNEQAFFKKIQTKCLEIYREHSECIYVASLLVDLYTFEGSYEAAEMLIDQLMNELDRVRKAYWLYRKEKLSEKKNLTN